MAEARTSESSKGGNAERVARRPFEGLRQVSQTGAYGAVLTLQRSAGNRAVGRLLGSGLNASPGPALQRKCASCAKSGGDCEDCGKKPRLELQPKLAVNEPGDVYEQEADRIAGAAMGMAEPQLQQQPVPVTPLVQRQAAGGESEGMEAAGSVHAAIASTGYPLDASTRAFFETRLGRDFSGVRVHTDSGAAESARAVDALAYTVGRDIVFGAGQYSPATAAGRRLLAHELTHTAQQGAHGPLSRAVIQREPKAPAGGAAASKCPGPAPGTAQKLTMQPSKHGEPCACLLVIHNNEQNARETAKLMHEHCSYNLVLLEPDDQCRRIVLPHHTADLDPNELFPEDIARQCTNDKKSCEDFIKGKSASTKQSEVRKSVQMQFFLTISDCSKSFALPVVALHNNDVSETAKYRKGITGPSDVKDFELDVDKKKKETGEDQLKKIKDSLEKKVGADETKSMLKKGRTNIFRWCVSDELARCHIGDPEHPDNVTWVTNEKDFDTLSKKKVNVALQAPAVKGGESEKDLSTLFLILKTVFSEQSLKVIESLEKEITVDQDALRKLIEDLKKLNKAGDMRFSDEWGAIIDGLILLLTILLRKLSVLAEQGKKQAREEKLRFVNIEAPGESLKSQSDVERIRNYKAIVEVLTAVGLHCCPDSAKAEAAVEEGLKIDEKAKAKKKEEKSKEKKK